MSPAPPRPRSVAAEDAPTVRLALPTAPRRRRWPVVVGGLLVVALTGLGVVVAMRPPPDATPVAAVGALASPTPAAPAAPTSAASVAGVASSRAAASTGCPGAEVLVAEYRRHGTSPTRDGAVARGPVVCASRFAALEIRSPGDSETVSAMFAVGPPARFLAAGSGPVCTDDPAALPGAVVVPHSAAKALDCATTPGGTAAGAAPTLGSVWSPNQHGFGSSRPAEINAGGDSTGIVEGITWTSWGGVSAQGRGTGYWIGPDQASYQATRAPAVVIVDRLGTCHGHPAYLRVRWYFPTHGETSPAKDTGFDDICGAP